MPPCPEDSFGLVCEALRDIGLRDANDRNITSTDRDAGEPLILSGDGDFVDPTLSHGPSPQALRLNRRNLTSARVQRVRCLFQEVFANSSALLAAGHAVVEI